jgi:hypothetical protein
MSAGVNAHGQRGYVHAIAAIMLHGPSQLEWLIARPNCDAGTDRLRDVDDLHVRPNLGCGNAASEHVNTQQEDKHRNRTSKHLVRQSL